MNLIEMSASVREWINAPVQRAGEQAREAQLLNHILLAFVAAVLIWGIFAATFGVLDLTRGASSAVSLLLVMAPIWLLRRGYVQLSGWALTLGLSVLFFLLALYSGGLESPDLNFLVTLTVVAALVMGRRGAIVLSTISIFSLGILWWLGVNGSIPEPRLVHTPTALVLLFAVYFLVTLFLLFVAVGGIQEAIENARASARQLAERNDELEQSRQSLETQTAELARVNDEIDRFFALSAALLAIANFDGRFLRVNQAWEQSLGLATVDLLARPILSFVHPDDFEHHEDAQVQLVDGSHEPITFESRFRTPRGERWLQWKMVAVPEARQILCVAYDMTEQRQAEARRLEDQRRLEEIITAIPGGVIISGVADGVVLWANDESEQIIGIPAAELIGQEIHDFYAQPEERDALLEQLRRDGRVANYALRAKPVGGEPFWARLSLKLLEFRGTPAVLGIGQSIDELKRAEEALRESEARFRALVDVSFDAIVMSQDGVIFEANEAFARLFGYELDEVIGQTPHNMVAPESVDMVMSYIQSEFNKPYEVTGVRKDGSRFLVEVVGQAITYRGRRARVTGFRDVTEQRLAEQKLHQAQKLDSLGVLAGGIAHDFNNLLVAMLGQTSLARVHLPEEHPARRSIDKAVRAAEQASALTRQLLAYSGRGHFEVRRIDLNRLISDNLHLLKVAVPKRVELSTRLSELLPPIQGDPGQMQQVIMNLILNAVEAIDGPSGLVEISTQVCDINGNETLAWQPLNAPLQAGRYASLVVRDNGRGMDAATLASIFDPFYSTKETGHGLGLAAVLGIVRGHDGGLRVSSEVDNGTSFEVVFPAHDGEEETEPHVVTERAGAPSGGVVLVIDDEEAVCEAVNDILDLEGLEAITALNGEEGLTLFQENRDRIGLVLLDLSMPGISGEETYNRLQAIDPDVKVILSSGYSQLEATRHFVGKGLVDFIQKPYNFSALVEKVRLYL